MAGPPGRSRLTWLAEEGGTPGARRVLYRGPLRGKRLRLRYAFDGWRGDPHEAPLDPRPTGGFVAEIPDTAGHLAIDCAVTNGRRWDNNAEADYRLWLTIDPFDAHLHVSGKGAGPLGLPALQDALASAGIAGGLVSWPDNRSVAGAVHSAPVLSGLVWVRPGATSLSRAHWYLAAGFVGLKFHPTVDHFPADSPKMDPYLELADRAGVPVAIHSAPGDADPDHIRRLADRFPRVPILFYHSYLGPEEGRRRAVAHARERSNLYLEPSWCRADQVLRFVEAVGPDKVIFGSDAALDGPTHYRREPPNVEGRETYNEGLLRVVRALGPAAARQVMGENARRLFRIPAPPAQPNRRLTALALPALGRLVHALSPVAAFLSERSSGRPARRD